MTNTTALNELIFETVKSLPDKEKREVLNFIEYLKIRKQQSFVEYVNQRTREAVEARKQGKHFASLAELQQEYA